MTFYGLGEIILGSYAAHIDRGLSGGSRVRRPLSEDPHQRERKLLSKLGLVGFIVVSSLYP